MASCHDLPRHGRRQDAREDERSTSLVSRGKYTEFQSRFRGTLNVSGIAHSSWTSKRRDSISQPMQSGGQSGIRRGFPSMLICEQTSSSPSRAPAKTKDGRVAMNAVTRSPLGGRCRMRLAPVADSCRAGQPPPRKPTSSLASRISIIDWCGVGPRVLGKTGNPADSEAFDESNKTAKTGDTKNCVAPFCVSAAMRL